ncbi:hypothetical protein ACLB2K_052732 [Fragaria x ananassa]
MFQSTVPAKELTWHARGRKKDGMMRHPADSPTWKMVDTNWPDFGIEHRNLRLALSSDGFNPYGAVSSKYSCWPVILITYNLLSWLCMKRKYMMLTLLISGPKQLGNDIDVYLQPLVDDLKVLWDGIEQVYDYVRGEYFKLKTVLLWTINDFPAYGNLSGCVVKGYNACPICVDQTKPYRLKHSKKLVYLRNQRQLSRHHPYRKQASAFDNTVEKDDAPTPLTGEETFARVQGLPKANVRHNLDDMHIEKNCCDAILGTLLNILGKTKDGVASRLDMVDMGIHTDLKPTSGVKRDKLSLASWNLFVDERKIVCNSFFHMKGPSRFSSNIRNLVSVNDLKLGNLKSHDCHVIMQLLLPVAIRSVLEKPVRYAIIRFCLFFKAICSKVIDVSILKQMQADLVDTICLLEKFFPPSFFDIMIHLTVHLVREVELCGPVFFRWMYPFERYMKVFKGMVHNRTFPEGCITECYIVEEAVEFLEEHMLPEDVTTVGINKSSIPGLLNGCKRLSAPKIVTANGKLLDIAHLCILQNYEDVKPYFKEHMEFLKLSFPYNINNPKWMKDKQNHTFPDWFKKRVANEIRIADNEVPETIRWLAGGPNKEVPTFHGYHVNGVDFNTMKRDSKGSVQNSGVFLVADEMQVASAKDKRPTTVDMDFYGRIQQIWEVDYYKFRVPIFLCDWVESSRGVKVDELGFTLVKLDRIGHLNDPFVLATHVKQIFYIEDPLDAEWSVVVRCPDKDLKGGGDDDDDDDEVAAADDDYYDEDDNIVVEQHPYIPIMLPVESFDNVVGDEPNSYARPGDEGIWIKMRPSTSTTERARAVTLRMKVVAMKRSRSKYASPVKSSAQHSSPVKTASKVASLKKHTSPSLKKRKAGSNAASLKKRTSRRLNMTKSMSKSSNNSQQAQSDDTAQEEENLSGGLKLLKRGMVTMAQKAFVVPKKLRKSVIASATTKWRDFKSRLTSKYIMRYMNDVDLLEFPPDDYRFITKDVWQDFVAYRLSAGFQELRNEQVEKRKKNKYNHRLSRKGYRGMRTEMAATLSPEELEELGRYIYWIKARQDKDGKFLDVAVEEALERIVNLQKMEAEGKFKSQGMKDALTEALGNPEHRGKVRGVGGNVKLETYFDLPRRQKGRKKVSEEERESLFAKEKAKWEEEMKKKQAEVLAEAEAKWEKKFAMLEAKLEGKLLASESPQTVTAVNNDVGSRQGSCSRPWEQGNRPGCQAVKKMLVLGGCTNGKDAAEEELQPADGKEVVLKNEQPPDAKEPIFDLEM